MIESQAESPPILTPGQALGGCRILGFIGRGGMSEVYLAQQPALHRNVAIKILPPDRNSATLIERFLREARMCSRIEHPNVVTIHNVGEEHGLNFIVMQFIEGKNLTELLESHPNGLPWATAVRLAHLAGKGLHAVHEHDLLHRDVKPSNIMLANDGRLLLMDFGLVCQESGSDLTETGIVVGTVPYMSPEQCRGDATDRRSDIFSLGSTLYTLLTNKRPYAGTSTEVVTKLISGWKPPPVHQLNAQIPPEVSAIVAKAMSPRPEDRFPSARQMNKALSEVVRKARGDVSTSQDLIAVRSVDNTLLNLPQLEPVDTVEPLSVVTPLDAVEPLAATSTWADPAFDKRPWLIGGAVTAGLLLLGLIINLLVGGGDAATSGAPASAAVSSSVAKTNMVLIPAGRVYLGNDASEIRTHLQPHIASADTLKNLIDNAQESGMQSVPVEAFWIDRYEVTNADYSRFVQAAGRAPPTSWRGAQPPVGYEQFPVTGVSYDDAEAYAAWIGKQLPTAEQWVRAYRGDSRQLFPWGNDFSPDKANVNENKSFKYLAPVTAMPTDASPFGVLNLAGNASEFLRGYTVKDGTNMRMTKGAGYNESGAIYGNASATFYYAFSRAVNEGLGFRCVVTGP